MQSLLGYNAGYPDPVAQIIVGWQASPAHDGILGDRSLGRIGCAERVVAGRHYFACVLASGSGRPPPPVVTLPDTAMR